MIGTDHYLEAERLMAAAQAKTAEATKGRADAAKARSDAAALVGTLTVPLTTVQLTLKANLNSQADAADTAAAAADKVAGEARQDAAIHSRLATAAANALPIVTAPRQARGLYPTALVNVWGQVTNGMDPMPVK